MKASLQHRLEGIEPDNLLAFLALVGLMRAVNASRPAWGMRVSWDAGRPPVRPVLHLNTALTPSELAGGAAHGCELLANDHDFGPSQELDWSPAEARYRYRAAVAAGPPGRSRMDLLSGLACDVALTTPMAVKPADKPHTADPNTETEDTGRAQGKKKRKKRGVTLRATPLCLMHGVGHQFFLERLSCTPRFQNPLRKNSPQRRVTRSPAELIQTALYHPWQRRDATPTMRWDYAEYRLWGISARRPTNDPALTVTAANSLAALALAVMTVVPVSARGRIRVQAIGVRSVGTNTEVSWPIWERPLSLNALQALLSHSVLYEERPKLTDLRALGLNEVRRTTRVEMGRYSAFTRARAVDLDVTQ